MRVLMNRWREGLEELKIQDMEVRRLTQMNFDDFCYPIPPQPWGEPSRDCGMT